MRDEGEGNEIHEKYPLLFLTARAPGHSELPFKIWLNLVEANRADSCWTQEYRIGTSVLRRCAPLAGLDLLFSYRGENGKTGRLMGVVAS